MFPVATVQAWNSTSWARSYARCSDCSNDDWTDLLEGPPRIDTGVVEPSSVLLQVRTKAAMRADPFTAAAETPMTPDLAELLASGFNSTVANTSTIVEAASAGGDTNCTAGLSVHAACAFANDFCPDYRRVSICKNVTMAAPLKLFDGAFSECVTRDHDGGPYCSPAGNWGAAAVHMLAPASAGALATRLTSLESSVFDVLVVSREVR